MFYQKIKTHDIGNGDGVRLSLYVSGCHLRCAGCFSEETHSFTSGTLYTQETEDYIIEFLSKPYMSGLSLLGGNPTDNLNEAWLLNLVKRVRKELPHLTIYCWSGNTFEQLITDPVAVEFLSYIDMLRDGPYIASKLDLKQFLQGSTNQGYVDCKKSLDAGKRINYKFDEL